MAGTESGAGTPPVAAWTPPALVYFATTGEQVEVSSGDLAALEERERGFLRGLLRSGKRRLDEVDP